MESPAARHAGSVEPETANIEELRRLADEAAIVRQIKLYCRGVDRGDADIIRSTYHEDATEEHGVFSGSAHQFADFCIEFLAAMESSSHNISNIIVDIVGDHAFAETYFVAHSMGMRDESGARYDLTLGGRYLDNFEKRDGAWKVSHRQAIYDWNTVTPSTGHWDGPLHSQWKRGQFGHGDMLFKFLDAIANKARRR